MNVQTAGGVVFRANRNVNAHNDGGFAGYLAFVANALGVSNDDIAWDAATNTATLAK